MRVVGRALILGFLVSICAPVATFAATLSLGDGALCGDRVASTTQNCSFYGTLDPFGPDPLTITGGFDFDNEVALFELFFDTSTQFSVTATSTGDGIFDPAIGLFYAEGPSRGEAVTYLDPVQGELRAISYDVNLFDNFDAQLDLTLEGRYYLALIKYSNEFNGAPVESLLAGFNCDNPEVPCDFDPGLRDYSITMSAEADGAPAPVPEPGTLTLMAGGAIAGLLQRRRTRKRQDRSSSVSR